MNSSSYEKIGILGRFKPLHLDGASLLEDLCASFAEVIIGIGSSNRYNARNPFTAEESKEMIDLALAPNYSNYSFRFLPDYGHLPGKDQHLKWKLAVFAEFGYVDYFVTGNPYVKKLLQYNYEIIDTLANTKRISSTEVRRKMVRDEDWESLVPPRVADFLKSRGLVDRFKQEFGLQTLENLKTPSLLEEEIKALKEE